MRRLCALLLALLIPCCAAAETLPAAIDQAVAGLDLTELEAALTADAPFAATGGLRETIRAVARGEMTLGLDELMQMLSNRFLGAAKTSLWRLTRLMIPALLWSVLRHLSGKGGEAGQAACYLLICAFLASDLADHAALCTDAVAKMSGGMQGLFPVLLTLMTAMGGASGSAIMQPALAAASGMMTGVISSVTLPLTIASAMLTMLTHLGDGLRVSRLAGLVRQLATWTLGGSFTAFIGVLVTRGVTAAAVDGVTLRTAKYTLDNFVPVVGGLFADTVDTLVGSAMLVQSALGVTGLLLLIASCAAPLCQTLAAGLMYRLAAALMEPVGDGPLSRCIHDFSGVIMLLFVIELCAAAMFVMLIAQVIAVSSMTVMLR
ncbi:MAG: stage III sporulation protein AE [Clostridia bacterium]|nr:stage III sporulation protein AE [Clostridia bacterium]